MKTTRLLSMMLVAAFGLLMWQAPAAAEETPAPPKQDQAKKDEAPAHKTAKKKTEEKKEEPKPSEKPAEKPAEKP